MYKLFYFILSGLVALLFSSCVSNLTTSDYSLSSPVSVSAEERAIAERVYALVNAEREVSGKKALLGHYGLNRLAQKHSLFLGSNFGSANHFGSENRAQFAYLKYSIENLSEMTYVVPFGSEDPALDAVEAWKSSPSHRNHMLQSWDLTGIGVDSSADGETYITICMGAQPLGTPRSIRPIGW